MRIKMEKGCCCCFPHVKQNKSAVYVLLEIQSDYATDNAKTAIKLPRFYIILKMKNNEAMQFLENILI